MDVFDRLSQIIRSNIHDRLDKAENPIKMANQFLREMQQGIEAGNAQVLAMIAEEKKLAAEVEFLRRTVSDWGRKAKAASDARQVDLVREAILRKRDAESNLQLHEQQHKVQEQAVALLQRAMSQIRSKYQHTIALRDQMVAAQEHARATGQIAATLSSFSTLDPETDFNRMSRKLRGVGAQAAAELEMATQSFDARFASLEDPDVELEVQALMNGGSIAFETEGDDYEAPALEEFDLASEILALKNSGTAGTSPST